MEQGRTCQKARSRLFRFSNLAPEQFVGIYLLFPFADNICSKNRMER